MSTYHTGTYTGFAGAPTVVLPPLSQVPPTSEEPKSHREQPAWRAGYRCLLNLASILAGACLLLWVIWGFTSDGVPYVARVVMSWAAGLTTMSAIVTVLVACAVRILGQHIDVATTRIVSSVRALQTLRGEQAATHALVEQVYARGGRVEQALGGRLVGLLQRVDDLDGRFEDLATIARIFATEDGGNGRVRQLHPPPPDGRRHR